MGYHNIWTTLIAKSAFALAQAVFIDPSFAVLGPQGQFRDSSFTQFFNPTNTGAPFFQVFDQDFHNIIGTSPSIHQIASEPNATFEFAHEAPIYVPETDEVFFSSGNVGGPSNVIRKISLAEVDAALLEGGNTTVNVSVTEINLPESIIQVTNGGTGPYHSSLLLVTSGQNSIPPSIALVNPRSPNNVTVLLDNYYGRQFNSLNDIKIHRPSGNFLFTDVNYGSLHGFRPEPLMPNQVYRFDPVTRRVRVVATDFGRCNGIALSEDGKLAYVTDTAAAGENLGNNQTQPATIYAFDVDPDSQTFLNRRVFAYADTGIPDGIQIDKNGNVYAGCGDGVQVWNSHGILLGKIFLGSTSANMIFAGDGRLVILAETKIFLASIAAQENRLEFP